MVVNTGKKWNNEVKDNNAQAWEDYQLISERKITRDSYLLIGTTTIENGSTFYVVNLNVVTKRDNYIVLLIASVEAWDASEKQLTDLALSFTAHKYS